MIYRDPPTRSDLLPGEVSTGVRLWLLNTDTKNYVVFSRTRHPFHSLVLNPLIEPHRHVQGDSVEKGRFQSVSLYTAVTETSTSLPGIGLADP